MSTQTDQLTIRPDDVFCWLELHGWETTDSEQWGEIAYRPDPPGGCVRKSRAGHVVAADVAHCLGVSTYLVMQAVQKGWSPTKAQYLDAGDKRPSQGGGR